MAGEGMFGPILSMAEKDPVLKRKAIPIDANLSRWWHSEAKDLESKAAADAALTQRITDRYEAELPGLDAIYDKDRSFLEELRPGGTQERRFSDLIRDSMVKQREAAGIGLDQARAGYKARMALGGNSPFADSSFARLSYALPEMNLESQLAAQESAAQIDNAYRFLSGYNPGQALGLAAQRQAYDMTPINMRNLADAMKFGRADSIGSGIRQSEDATMYWKQPKNWASWVKALDDTGARVAQTAMSVYGAVGGMGGAGAGSSGSGSGGIGGPPTGAQSYGPQPAFVPQTTGAFSQAPQYGGYGMSYAQPPPAAMPQSQFGGGFSPQTSGAFSSAPQYGGYGVSYGGGGLNYGGGGGTTIINTPQSNTAAEGWMREWPTINDKL